ncbi:hypothetical protein AB0M43_00080 [Longispora sp. NPDC051575]|uniref:hypothetical protein n=1 Tax=Longispora sp. NPDC051575 TaxID=3154943 RepID=UPI0034460103
MLTATLSALVLALPGTAQAAPHAGRLDSSLTATLPSDAASSTGTLRFTIPAGVVSHTSTTQGASTTVTKLPHQAGLVVNCTLTPGSPFRYYGGPGGGGVQGIANVNCDGVVAQITTEAALFRYSTQISYSTRTVYNTTVGNALTSVSPFQAAQYKLGSIATITWTAGGSSSSTPLIYGPTVTL